MRRRRHRTRAALPPTPGRGLVHGCGLVPSFRPRFMGSLFLPLRAAAYQIRRRACDRQGRGFELAATKEWLPELAWMTAKTSTLAHLERRMLPPPCSTNAPPLAACTVQYSTGEQIQTTFISWID